MENQNTIPTSIIGTDGKLGIDSSHPIILPKMPITEHYTFEVGNGEDELNQLLITITTEIDPDREGTTDQDKLKYNQPYCFVEVIFTELPPFDNPKCFLIHNQFVFRCNIAFRKDKKLKSNPTVYFCDKLITRGIYKGNGDFEISDDFIMASSCVDKDLIWTDAQNKDDKSGYKDYFYRTRRSFEIDGVDFMPENFDVLPPFKPGVDNVLQPYHKKEILMFKLIDCDSVIIRNSSMQLRNSNVTNIVIYNAKHALIENCNLSNENYHDPEVDFEKGETGHKTGFNRWGGILWFLGNCENITVRNNTFFKWGNDEILAFFNKDNYYGYIRRNVLVTGNTLVYGRKVKSNDESYDLDILITVAGGCMNTDTDNTGGTCSYTQFENFCIENNRIILNDQINGVVAFNGGGDGTLCEMENVTFRNNYIEHNWLFNRNIVEGPTNKKPQTIEVLYDPGYYVTDFAVRTRSLGRDSRSIPAVRFENNEIICHEQFQESNSLGHAFLESHDGSAELINNRIDAYGLKFEKILTGIIFCRNTPGNSSIVARGNYVNSMSMLMRTEGDSDAVYECNLTLENNNFKGDTSSSINRNLKYNLTLIDNRFNTNSDVLLASLLSKDTKEEGSNNIIHKNINISGTMWINRNIFDYGSNYLGVVDNVHPPRLFYNVGNTNYNLYNIGYGILMHNNIIRPPYSGTGNDKFNLSLPEDGTNNHSNLIADNKGFFNPDILNDISETDNTAQS